MLKVLYFMTDTREDTVVYLIVNFTHTRIEHSIMSV